MTPLGQEARREGSGHDRGALRDEQTTPTRCEALWRDNFYNDKHVQWRGQAASGPLIQRQHYGSQPWTDNGALDLALGYLEVIFEAGPRR